jgi:ribosomal protein S18 acetylase RimI-like enzyme/catechol 2,3-dioxygenase-like lactoylglutathione lyase family enzyme
VLHSHVEPSRDASMPKPDRLFEAHLTVADLDRSIAFYRDVVGLPLAFELRERAVAFFWIGERGGSMLGLWSLGSAPVGLSLHVAFRVSLDEVLAAGDALRAAGVTQLSFFGTEASEPSVIGWMPAAAVYFRDPDGHQLEYLAMLDDPPDPERGIVSWSEWTSADPQPVRIERHAGPRAELRALFAEAEDSAAELDAYVELGDVLVARHGDHVVGHLQLVDAADAEHRELKNMAVKPSCRGRGVGRALIEAAIDVARAERRATIVVATAAADVGNLRFYQRAGFRLRAVERDAFTPATGYAPGLVIDGMQLRDRVWLDLDVAAA